MERPKPPSDRWIPSGATIVPDKGWVRQGWRVHPHSGTAHVENLGPWFSTREKAEAWAQRWADKDDAKRRAVAQHRVEVRGQ